MNTFVKKTSDKSTFSQAGLKGFRVPLENKDVEMYVVDVAQGHDTFIISKTITHIYYVLQGTGFFTINDKRIDVDEGSVVEVPPRVEYTYTGTMKLLLIMSPPWFEGNETIVKKNPAVK